MPSADGASQFFNAVRCGRVTNLLMHAGADSNWWRWLSRYCEGVMPTICAMHELKDPSELQPTARHAAVTEEPWRRRAIALSIRRVIRYECGVSPYESRNLREKCAGDIIANRAIAVTSKGRE